MYNNYNPTNYMGANYAPVLNGRIVDSVEVAKTMEVPIGGYGIFPKADLSEVYIKSWNPNGTTSVTTFRPIVEEKKVPLEEQINELREQVAEMRAMVQSQGSKPAKEVKHEF